MKKTSRASKKTSVALLTFCLLLASLLPLVSGCLGLKPNKSTLASRRVLEGVRTSMVRVHIYFKRDIANEFGPGQQGVSFQERLARRMVERKMSLDLGGIVLDEQGHIIIADPETEIRFIDRIEVIAQDGRIRQASLLTILKKMDAAILEVSDSLGLKPIKFTRSDQLEQLISSGSPQDPLKKPLPLLQILSIYRAGREWHVRRGPLAGSFRYDSDDQRPEYFLGSASGGASAEFSGTGTMGTTPSVIADRDGNFIGLTMRGIVDLKQKHRIWRGQDILEAMSKDLNADEFRGSRQALKEEYSQIYHQVKIYYRQPAEDDYGSMALPERIVYGLAIDPTTLLIPLEISRREAKQIESIEVTLNGQDELSGASDSQPTEATLSEQAQTCSAELIGAYRDFAAFIVRVKDARFAKWVDLDRTGRISRVVPVQTVYARRRFGRKDINVWYARCLREIKGYDNAMQLESSLPIFPGSLLLDLDGRLAGFYLRQKLPAEEQRIMERMGTEYYSLSQQGYAPSGSGLMRIFRIAEIAPALRNPAQALDSNIRAMTKAQAKRRMWLGVEYVPLDRELAKRVNLEPLTKDGSIGFRVSAVYQGSPAVQMGIQLGDVLLRIKDRAREYPTELRTSLAGGSRGGYGRDRGGARVWRSRRNFLTEFLSAIGQGSTIEVSFCSPRRSNQWTLFSKTVEVQQAPLDYDSAKKYRDRTIGLTVRDLTYEVRQALKMSTDAPGVVVSKIEEGTPAAVAKINEGELITRVDSNEVTSVDDFKDRIAAARQSDRDSIKVEIVRLGKTRVADLSLSD